MIPVEFHLLGPPSLRIAGRSIRLRSAKTVALLAYLLEPNTAHSREKLAGLLWGESPEEKARMSLRQSLRSIRQVLGDWETDCLVLKKSSVAFQPQPDFWVDAIEFMDLATCDGKPPDALRRATQLYRGLLLEGIAVYDSPAFEDWLFLRRDTFTQHTLSVLQALAEHLIRGGSHAEAMSVATRLVSMDASHEGGHRCLMRCHAARGDLDAVRRQYRLCTDVLSRQLGVEPTAETQKLYRQLTKGKQTEGTAEPPTGVRPPSVAPQIQRRGEVTSPLHLARRLCEVAQPGQILVGESTYRLTYRAFEFQVALDPDPIGVALNPDRIGVALDSDQIGMQPELRLKEDVEQISAYQVLTVLPKPEKVRGIEGLTAPMIGRDEPFAKLKGCLENVMAGSGQMVSIIGTAGVGKSRLVRELKEIAISIEENGKTRKRDHR